MVKGGGFDGTGCLPPGLIADLCLSVLGAVLLGTRLVFPWPTLLGLLASPYLECFPLFPSRPPRFHHQVRLSRPLLFSLVLGHCL